MNIQVKIVGLFLGVVVSFQTYAQDIHFSQRNMAPSLLSPTEIGRFSGDQRAHLNYRNQWGQITNAYKTIGVSFDTGINKKKNGNSFLALGGSAYADKAGDANFQSITFKFGGAYHTKMSQKSFLSGGLQAGFFQRSVDRDALIFEDQYDGDKFNTGIASQDQLSSGNFFTPDFSAGLSYSFYDKADETNMISDFGKSFTVGVAMYHIAFTEHSFLGESSEKLASKLQLFGTSNFVLTQGTMFIQPMVVFSQQLKQQELLIGANLRTIMSKDSKIATLGKGAAANIGLAYRNGDAIILMGGLEFGNYTLGISYDYNISGLDVATKSVGGFEIGIKYRNPNPFFKEKLEISNPRI